MLIQHVRIWISQTIQPIPMDIPLNVLVQPIMVVILNYATLQDSFNLCHVIFEKPEKLLKDECALMTHDCHTNANCIDEDIGFTCECWNPFIDLNGDGRNCEDFDECTDQGFHV